MKKKLLLVMFIIFSVFSLSEDRTLSILVPSDLTKEKVTVTGWVEGVTNPVYIDNGIEVNFESGMITYGGETKYLNVVVKNPGETAGVKIAVGYPLTSESIPTYVVVADPEAATKKFTIDGLGEVTLEELFASETRELKDLLDAADFDYTTFPGKYLSESTRLSGFIVGDQPSDETNDPSNIVDVFYKNGDLGNATNEVLGDATINPTGSGTNNEFELWAIKVYPDDPSDPEYDQELAGTPVYQENEDGSPKYRLDEKGNIVYKLDNEGNPTNEPYYLPVRTLLYSNKSNLDPGPLYSDFSEFIGQNTPPDGIWYASEENNPDSGGYYQTPDGEDIKFGYYDYFKFDIQVRFQDGQGSLMINGEKVDFNKAGFRWDFLEADDVTLSYDEDTKEFKFGLAGKEVIIIGDKPGEIPLPVEEKYFVIDDTGEAMKSEASILSKYKNTERERKTNVIMKVITKEGESEKSFDITSISE